MSGSAGAGSGGIPQIRQLQSVVGLFVALAKGDGPSIKGLTGDMTLEEGTLACFAVGQLLLKHLAEATGKTLEELAAQISLEVETSTA